MEHLPMLEHGGRLRAAAQRYGIPLGDWLDLSTGIASHAYPVPALPPATWQRLPEDDDGLAAAACRYYGARKLLALPGSQAAIQLLPRLRSPGTVVVLAPTYAEYAAAWIAAGHTVRSCTADELVSASKRADVVVVGNPNNPTGQCFARTRLESIAAELKTRSGWLIVDEAFADADSSDSLAALAGSESLSNGVVLRSIGKFFGLAGARVGFAMAADAILRPLAEAVGPWAVAHPARVVAQAALADGDWQAVQVSRLRRDGGRLLALLRASGMSNASGVSLFSYAETNEAQAMYEFFARRGILLRVFEQPAALRFGLPANEAEWQRLSVTLELWRHQ